MLKETQSHHELMSFHIIFCESRSITSLQSDYQLFLQHSVPKQWSFCFQPTKEENGYYSKDDKNNELHIFAIFLLSMKVLEKEESILKGEVRRLTW